MAILTQIGGISTGGLTGALEGPLKALFGTKKGVQMFQYPINLGNDPSRMHIVQFAIKNVVPRKFEIEKTFSAISGSAYETKSNLAQNGAIISTKVENKENINAILSPKKTNNSAIITLYMPDTLAMNYQQQYNELTLTDATGGFSNYIQAFAGSAASLYEGYKNGDTSAAFGNLAPEALVLGSGAITALGARKGVGLDLEQVTDLALKTQARALNPQVQLLYRGAGLRDYTMEFIFTPKSKEEADQVSAIINTFIYASSPSVTGGGGMFFIPPSEVEIKFLMAETGNFSAFTSMLQKAGNSIIPGLDLGNSTADALGGNKDTENERLYKVGTSIIESLSVDYAPNGWAAHENGAPVQTRLTLNFRELEIVTRNRLRDGVVR